MLNKIINNPDLEKYMITFESDQIIFLEGDDSQDLYILVSGKLDILKGNKKLADITEPGNLFGEMSFLLGSKRTATAKTREKVKALRIPKEEISEFLEKFPEVTEDVTRLLARRLDETNQILYGLKEFCDQLPDAVILTDRDGKILTWNSIAEKIYGRNWEDMHRKSAKEIYEEPQDYMSYLEEVQSRYSVREKIFKIRHPERGIRFISTSTTVLFDGHHNFQGLLSLGRDVTRFKEMENRYRAVRKWIIPSFIILCFLAASVFFTLPYLKGDSSLIRDTIKLELRNQLGKDYLLLRSLLGNQFASRDRLKTSQLMKDFFDIQENEESPYLGLVLLDERLVVFDAYSIKAGATGSSQMIGNSYSGIDFSGDETSLHRVLTLYRTDKDHPMGRKGIEVAFEMSDDDELTGWLIFQMDPELLNDIYGINEEDLKKFRFRKS
jgi:PAS domain S-box-containing protein